MNSSNDFHVVVNEKVEHSNDGANEKPVFKSEDEPQSAKRKVDDTIKFVTSENDHEYIFHIEQSGRKRAYDMNREHLIAFVINTIRTFLVYTI